MSHSAATPTQQFWRRYRATVFAELDSRINFFGVLDGLMGTEIANHAIYLSACLTYPPTNAPRLTSCEPIRVRRLSQALSAHQRRFETAIEQAYNVDLSRSKLQKQLKHWHNQSDFHATRRFLSISEALASPAGSDGGRPPSDGSGSGQ